MKAISLQLRNQSTVKLFNQNIISIQSFKRSRYPLKMMDLFVLTAKFYIMFNMNFTKDL